MYWNRWVSFEVKLIPSLYVWFVYGIPNSEERVDCRTCCWKEGFALSFSFCLNVHRVASSSMTCWWPSQDCMDASSIGMLNGGVAVSLFNLFWLVNPFVEWRLPIKLFALLRKQIKHIRHDQNWKLFNLFLKFLFNNKK